MPPPLYLATADLTHKYPSSLFPLYNCARQLVAEPIRPDVVLAPPFLRTHAPPRYQIHFGSFSIMYGSHVYDYYWEYDLYFILIPPNFVSLRSYSAVV